MKRLCLYFTLVLTLVMNAPAAIASEGAALPHVDISLDQKTLRAGLTVFTDICMGCHSAKYLTYQSLMAYPQIGLSREEVDELREDKPLLSGLITELTPEDAAVSYGKVPPDLSVIAPGRRGHGQYIAALLTGYEADPEGKVPEGNFNKYFPGHRIAMPDPLSWYDHDPDDEADLKEQARTVASFLVFIGDPHQLERKAIGVWVMGFLVLLTLVLYLLKKEVWKDVKH